MNVPAARIKMEAGFYISFFLITWILSMSSQIEASRSYCDPYTPLEACKISEVPPRRIQFRVCGSVLRSYFGYACGFRKRRRRNVIAGDDQIFLEKQRANRFLSSHHRSRRSFNAVEECCVEGCVWEELFEYCKPTQY
ncbi:insulin-like peptide IlO1_i1 [Oculina patagonica]